MYNHKERHSQLSLHIQHILSKAQKLIHTTQLCGNFEFPKMTREGAGRTQTSAECLQVKKGKMWPTVPTDWRQNYIYKDLTKLKLNAARMSAKQLQILDFKQFWPMATTYRTLDSEGKSEGSCLILSPLSFLLNLVMHNRREKLSHNLFRSLLKTSWFDKPARLRFSICQPK